MKARMILAALCLCLGVSAMAQESNNQRRAPRQQADAVVDTAVINKMGLDAKMIGEITTLQTAKMQEQREMMKNTRPEKGKKMTADERKAMQEKRAAFTAEYRAGLRKIMGDKLYISYLEKQVDSRQNGRTNRQGNNQRQNNDGNQRGQRGGMGGGNDFGGGMGGDF